MDNPRSVQLLINVAGAVVGLIIIGYVVWASVQTTVEPPCSARYPAGTRFSLQTSQGKPLTAIQLQARAGARDLGVIDNASVVQVADGPSPDALEVKLRKLPGDADTSDRARNGIEFRWGPPGMVQAQSACLSYSVFLPEKFEFGGGGFLPGVFTGSAATASTGVEGSSVSPAWSEQGQPLLTASLGGAGIRRAMSSGKAVLPTNRWVRIEQEVVLNEAGKEDGRARLWVDGTLVVDDRNIGLRASPATFLGGVLAAVGYRGVPANPGTVRLSPFEIAWQ
jgi:hypothetical protein